MDLFVNSEQTEHCSKFGARSKVLNKCHFALRFCQRKTHIFPLVPERTYVRVSKRIRAYLRVFKRGDALKRLDTRRYALIRLDNNRRYALVHVKTRR